MIARMAPLASTHGVCAYVPLRVFPRRSAPFREEQEMNELAADRECSAGCDPDDEERWRDLPNCIAKRGKCSATLLRLWHRRRSLTDLHQSIPSRKRVHRRRRASCGQSHAGVFRPDLDRDVRPASRRVTSDSRPRFGHPTTPRTPELPMSMVRKLPRTKSEGSRWRSRNDASVSSTFAILNPW